MFQKLLLAGLTTTGLLFTSGCWGFNIEKGNGDIVDELRDVDDFVHVEVHSGLDIQVKDGDSTSIELEMDSNLLDKIETVVEGDTLVVRPAEGNFGVRPSKGTQIRISAPNIESIEASGGSDAKVELEESDDVTLRASGGSDIRAQMDVRSIEAKASGGSDIEISGESRSIDANASGGSDIQARELEVEEAKVNSSGGSDISLGESQSIEGSASGGSDVCYSGDPDEVNVSTSGGSDVSSC